MTYREMMTENNENLSWCAPYSLLGGRIVIAATDGKISSMQIDGTDVPVSGETIRRAAEMANECYESYQGWSDTHILLDANKEELPCRMCPWFGVCDAMDEEAYDDQ